MAAVARAGIDWRLLRAGREGGVPDPPDSQRHCLTWAGSAASLTPSFRRAKSAVSGAAVLAHHGLPVRHSFMPPDAVGFVLCNHCHHATASARGASAGAVEVASAGSTIQLNPPTRPGQRCPNRTVHTQYFPSLGANRLERSESPLTDHFASLRLTGPPMGRLGWLAACCTLCMLAGRAPAAFVECAAGDCPRGGCTFQGCDAPVSCRGGGCSFVRCAQPVCEGGKCVFTACKEPRCPGGLCQFEAPQQALGPGSCRGGSCSLDGARYNDVESSGLSM